MLEAAVVLLQRVVPAAEHLERLGRGSRGPAPRSRRAPIFSSMRTLFSKYSAAAWKLPRPILDDADVVVRRDEVPQIALGSRRAPGSAGSTAAPCSQSPSFQSVLPRFVDAILQSCSEPTFSPIATASIEDARASAASCRAAYSMMPSMFFDVAVDDVRLASSPACVRARSASLARRVEVVPLAVKPGDAVQHLRDVDRLAEPLVMLEGVLVVRQRRFLLAALAQHLADLLHHARRRRRLAVVRRVRGSGCSSAGTDRPASRRDSRRGGSRRRPASRGPPLCALRPRRRVHQLEGARDRTPSPPRAPACAWPDRPPRRSSASPSRSRSRARSDRRSGR